MEINDVSLLSEFMANPQNTPEANDYFTLLNSEMKKKNSDNRLLSGFLAKYVHSVSMGVGVAASSYILSDQYSSFSNDNKASIIREIMSPGVKNAYSLLATSTGYVLKKELALAKAMIHVKDPVFDDKRMNAVLKKAIGTSFAGDQEKAANFVKGSFQNISATGSRDIFTTTFEHEQHKGMFVGKRMTTSKNPCPVCEELNGHYFHIGAADEKVKQFHDHCSCIYYVDPTNSHNNL